MNHENIHQEWGRLPGPGQRLEGLSRAELYQLVKDGRIRSKSIRKPGKDRGIRLLHIPSIRAWIEATPDDQPAKGGGDALS